MEILIKILPSIGTIVAVALVLFAVQRLLRKGQRASSGHQFRDQVLMIALTAVGVLVVILVIPLGDTMRGQVLGLIGIVLSGAIALSSTTFLGNAMAALMLRGVGNFRAGDFIRAGDHFGRVSERGLFHTEIQTEDRELTTLPNLFLVTNPVTTIRASGTIVSTTVSLGYDVSRGRVEELLLQAAEDAGLTDPFVHVTELGDFSVTYRIAGLLSEVKRLISFRSKLRKSVLDSLHEGGVEIVSPNFMNTRALEPDARIIPKKLIREPETLPETSPEELVFDKAEEAESLDKMRQNLADLAAEIDAQEEKVKAAAEGPERENAERDLSRLQRKHQRYEEIIANREARAKNGDV